MAFSHATEIKIQPSTTADNLVIAVTTDDDRELKFAMTATELRYYVNGTLKWTK